MAMGNLSKSLSEPGAPLWSVQEAKALLFSRSPGEQIFSCKPNSQPPELLGQCSGASLPSSLFSPPPNQEALTQAPQ